MSNISQFLNTLSSLSMIKIYSIISCWAINGGNRSQILGTVSHFINNNTKLLCHSNIVIILETTFFPLLATAPPFTKVVQIENGDTDFPFGTKQYQAGWNLSCWYDAITIKDKQTNKQKKQANIICKTIFPAPYQSLMFSSLCDVIQQVIALSIYQH